MNQLVRIDVPTGVEIRVMGGSRIPAEPAGQVDVSSGVEIHVTGNLGYM